MENSFPALCIRLFPRDIRVMLQRILKDGVEGVNVFWDGEDNGMLDGEYITCFPLKREGGAWEVTSGPSTVIHSAYQTHISS